MTMAPLRLRQRNSGEVQDVSWALPEIVRPTPALAVQTCPKTVARGEGEGRREAVIAQLFVARSRSAHQATASFTVSAIGLGFHPSSRRALPLSMRWKTLERNTASVLTR